MFVDFPSLRLQYEILNKSLAEIALDINIPLKAIEQEAENNDWVQWFPESNKIDFEDLTISLENEEEVRQELIEEYINHSKQRLAIYNIAKEILLAHRYFELEIRIVKEANEILNNLDNLDAKTVKTLSSLYVDMTKTSVSNALASLSFQQDENGLPTVIIKDLSGQKKG